MEYKKTLTDINNILDSGETSVNDALAVMIDFLNESEIITRENQAIVVKKPNDESDYPDILTKLSVILPRLIAIYNMGINNQNFELVNSFIREELLDADIELKRVNETLENNKNEITEWGEKEAELQAKANQLNDSIVDLKKAEDEYNTLSASVSIIEADLKRLGAEDWPSKKAKKEIELSEKKAERDSISTEQDELFKKEFNIEAEIKEIKEDIKCKKEQLKTLEQEKKDKEEECNNIKDSIAAVEKWVDEYPRTMESWKNKYNNYVSMMIDLQNPLPFIDSSQINPKDVIIKMKEEMNSINSDIEQKLEEFRLLYVKTLKMNESIERCE